MGSEMCIRDRAADKKDLDGIFQELEDAKRSITGSAFAGDTRKSPSRTLVEKMPRFARRLILRYIMSRNPVMRRKFFGTVGLSALAMFAGGNGYAIPITPHVLSLLVGGFGKKPLVVGDRVVPREVISLTLAMNHDIVDGAPGVRLMTDLNKRLLAGFGIEEHLRAVTSET